MTLPFNLQTKVGQSIFRSPIILASGTWPYDKTMWTDDLLQGVGAVCGKAISYKPRSGNAGTRIWETPCGVLNSIGLQNPGAEHFLQQVWPTLCDHTVPLVLNITVESLEDLEGSLKTLKSIDKGTIAELNVSCPNVSAGCMAWGVDPIAVGQVTDLARSLWNGPIWVKLTPQAPDPVAVALSAQEHGADGVVVANTWLGMSMDLRRGRPAFGRVVAGLSGPAIFPLALRLVWQVAEAVSIPVIGCGGVSTGDDLASMLMAGASAVQVGVATFSDLHAPRKMIKRLEEIATMHHLNSIDELVNYGRRTE